jgi:hypothetical protein
MYISYIQAYYKLLLILDLHGHSLFILLVLFGIRTMLIWVMLLKFQRTSFLKM